MAQDEGTGRGGHHRALPAVKLSWRRNRLWTLVPLPRHDQVVDIVAPTGILQPGRDRFYGTNGPDRAGTFIHRL